MADAATTTSIDVCKRIHGWNRQQLVLEKAEVDAQGKVSTVPLPDEAQFMVGALLLRMIDAYKPKDEVERYRYYRVGIAISEAMEAGDQYAPGGPALNLIQTAAKEWANGSCGEESTTLFYGQVAPLLGLVEDEQ